MIGMFTTFLRSMFVLDETKFRIYWYCYANQESSKLIRFWSKITNIPSKQFSKPYVRQDFRIDGRKMQYGLIHVRYNDKKLLLLIKEFIEEYKIKYCVGWRTEGSATGKT